jgi:hypothetical protein
MAPDRSRRKANILVEPSLPIELPPAPSHLSEAMQSWWRDVVRDYDLEPHHLRTDGANPREQLMPVKRRLSKQHDGRITPTLVVAYARALELRKRAHRRDADRLAAHEAEATVDRALGGGIRRLWLVSVFDVYRFQYPGDPNWERTMEQRRKLDAAKAARRQQEPEPAAAS